jgi:hypothetical protein
VLLSLADAASRHQDHLPTKPPTGEENMDQNQTSNDQPDLATQVDQAQREREAARYAEQARTRAEAKAAALDITVPSGRYEVGGQLVDANGSPIDH